MESEYKSSGEKLQNLKYIRMKWEDTIFRMRREDTIFRMRARNRQTIAVSQSYNNKEGCLKGIQSVKSNAAGERIVILEEELEKETEVKAPV